MITYIFKRLVSSIPTMIALITIAFIMIRATPGGPFDSERKLSEEIQRNLEAAYHLDEPLIHQYFRYIGNILRGDFGPSFQYRDYTVNELIATGFPVSFKLGMISILLAFFVGTFLGSIAALKQNSWIDYTIMGTAMTGITIPNFVIAPMLSLIFGVSLGWLPVGGWQDGDLAHMILPILSLALPQVAYIARLTRGSMIEILRSPFIRTAHAKGLSESTIMYRHALKGALLPVISYLGPATANIITGSVVVEQIFGLPGIGRFFVQGALNRDYTLVLGVVVFLGLLIILFNLLVDIIYGFLDPRVRYT